MMPSTNDKNRRKRAKVKSSTHNKTAEENGAKGQQFVIKETSTQSLFSKTLSMQETCDLIAEISESVLENPEKAFVSTESKEDFGKDAASIRRSGPSKIRQLLNIAGRQQTESECYTAQLAMMSLVVIFKDVLPAYRIRLPTESEMAIKVSKDTKKLWDQEKALLQHYQSYLKLLESTWDDGKKKEPLPSISVTAALSLSEMLKSAFHFNFRSNLLTAVIRNMNTGSDEVATASCEAVEFVFANDAQGDVALEATRQVAKLIKDRGLNVKPAVLRTFLALPLRVHVDEAEAAKLVSQANAKKRKRDKEIAEIESELRESQASIDKVVLARCQSDMLQAVVLTYFRILKHENLKASHIEKLLPPALEGLAKFSHLIHLDTVVDLLGLLKNLMKNVQDLPLDAVLNCVMTAFLTLQGPGRELKIDQKEYMMPLYGALPRLGNEENALKHTEMMLECLTLAFINRREYSDIRVASFLKQILTTAMHAPAHTSIPLLMFARHLLQRYPSAQQMLENEQDVITSGQYTPTVEDPELTNAFATSAWELATLRFHIHPGISEQASAASSLVMFHLPRDCPKKLRANQIEFFHDLYIPFRRMNKKHPLAPKNDFGDQDNENGPNRNKRSNVRFIKPRDVVSIFPEPDSPPTYLKASKNIFAASFVKKS